jgi:hypothetical protein
MIYIAISMAILASASCVGRLNINTSVPFSSSKTITGIYKFVDGDRIFYNCGGDTCVDLLIRDKYLQEHGVDLNGRTVTIEVKRVLSCDEQKGDQTACLRSSGSAFRIVRWVLPAK